MPTYAKAEYCGYPVIVKTHQPNSQVTYVEAFFCAGDTVEVLVSSLEYFGPGAILARLNNIPGLILNKLTDPEPILRE